MSWRVRDATEHDAADCTAVYAPYVTDTAVTFEDEPPSRREMARRIAAAQERHAWLVLEHDTSVVGFAYGGAFRSRAAYAWTCEVSVYLGVQQTGRGGGRMLYDALLARLAERGFRKAVAGMTLPNDASVALHRSLGFVPVGTFQRVGWKHGAWRDVAWMQRPLARGDAPPEALR